MGWEFYVAQVLGVLTTISMVVSSQMKNMRHILLCQMAGNLLSAISSAMLGGLSGAWICGVASVQLLVLFMLDKKGIAKKSRLLLLFLFAIMYAAGTAVVYSSWRDLMSCSGALLFLLAIGQTKSSRYRIYICICGLLWTVYNLSILSFGSALTTTVEFASAAVGILRLDLKKKST